MHKLLFVNLLKTQNKLLLSSQGMGYIDHIREPHKGVSDRLYNSHSNVPPL